MVRNVFLYLTLFLSAGFLACDAAEPMPNFVSRVRETDEPMQTGLFEPTWESLEQYKTPEWFRDAKFGIWAHWGPQCQPERGDWYARHMYHQGHSQYNSHLSQYGHPSEFGFKDVIHQWKAENWDPDKLVSVYKKAGAHYFVAMANHHDNFDYWDSTYQPWNSVAVGPKKNIIAGWAEAARKHELPFGVSAHASHASIWYETARGADRRGPLEGVRYDGNLTREDGKGKWWEGLDPQDLYAQNQKRITEPGNLGDIHGHWHWTQTENLPDPAYCEKFYSRTLDLLNKYKPDLLYFDDTVLPFHPFNDAGFKIAAHFYNSSMKWNKGELRAVMNNKILSPEQRRTMVWDIEKGASNHIEPYPWQTCTCLGNWHYDRAVYEQKRYKSARTVIHMLADIVSKNGNLLLSVPLRGDGTFDSEAEKTLKGIGDWMAVNSEGIVKTRPWKVFGEGPAMEDVPPLQGQGFNEGRGRPMTWQDVRYTVSKDGKTLYAIVMGSPSADEITLRAVRARAASGRVSLLGHTGTVDCRIDGQGQFTITWPSSAQRRDIHQIACVFKLAGFDMEVNARFEPGAVVLKAEEAVLNGSQVRLEKRGERSNIGYWNNPDEDLHWLVKVSHAGDYEFTGEFAAVEASKLKLQVNEQNVLFDVPATGDWSRSEPVKMGIMHFDASGVYHLRLMAGETAAYRPVNVWQIHYKRNTDSKTVLSR
jgi:alpha-L-fucosidase